MRITGYRTATTVHDWGRPIGDANGAVDSGRTSVPVVIVTTDVGLEGIGLGSYDGIDTVFPALDGQDPRTPLAAPAASVKNRARPSRIGFSVCMTDIWRARPAAASGRLTAFGRSRVV